MQYTIISTYLSGLQINKLTATHCTNCSKHQMAHVHKQGAIVDVLHNHPLGCSVTPELFMCFSLSFFFFICICFSHMHLPVFFSHFLSHHTSCCPSSFLFLSLFILIQVNIFCSLFPLSIPYESLSLPFIPVLYLFVAL